MDAVMQCSWYVLPYFYRFFAGISLEFWPLSSARGPKSRVKGDRLAQMSPEKRGDFTVLSLTNGKVIVIYIAKGGLCSVGNSA